MFIGPSGKWRTYGDGMTGPFFAPIHRGFPSGIITDGLVERWPTKEGSGNFTYGSVSGTQMALTDTTWPNNCEGNCCALGMNGTSSFGEVAHDPKFEFGTGDFTVCAFVRPLSQTVEYPGGMNIVSKVLNASPWNGYIFHIWREIGTGGWPRVAFWPYDSGAPTRVYGLTNLLVDQCYHLIGERVAGVARVFVNGVDDTHVAHPNTSNVDSGEPLCVGADETGWHDPGWGHIEVEDIRIYNRELNAQEKLDIANRAG